MQGMAVQALAVSSDDLAELRRALKELSQQLVVLHDKRGATNEKLEQFLNGAAEVEPGLVSASDIPNFLSRKFAGKTGNLGQRSFTRHRGTHAHFDDDETSDGGDPFGGGSTSYRFHAPSFCDSEAPARMTQRWSIDSFFAQDPWHFEIMDRIRGAIERSDRGPQDVFAKFCPEGSDVLRKADILRVGRTFAQGLPDSKIAGLWETLGKAEDDTLTCEEFVAIFTHRGGQAPSLAAFQAADPELAEMSPRSAADRQERIYLFRFGCAVQSCEALRGEILNAGRDDGLALAEFLDICGQQRVPLSRQEAVSVFTSFVGKEGASRIPMDVISNAMDSEPDELPPPEIRWMRQVLAYAEDQSKTADTDLSDDLQSFAEETEGVLTVDFSDLQHVVSRVMRLEKEECEALMQTVDKQMDGRLLLEPLLKNLNKEFNEEQGVADGPVAHKRERLSTAQSSLMAISEDTSDPESS